jgi:hypothetical protein
MRQELLRSRTAEVYSLMAWEIEITDQFADWYENVTFDEAERINVAVEQLELHGPALRRPYVGTIKRSRYKHIKELIPHGGFIRILFAFDPRRHAILLIGGDKTDQWDPWYDQMIPIADKLYTEYLDELRKEGEIL